MKPILDHQGKVIDTKPAFEDTLVSYAMGGKIPDQIFEKVCEAYNLSDDQAMSSMQESTKFKFDRYENGFIAEEI